MEIINLKLLKMIKYFKLARVVRMPVQARLFSFNDSRTGLGDEFVPSGAARGQTGGGSKAGNQRHLFE